MNYSTSVGGALLLSPAQIIETISRITEVSIPDILSRHRKKEKVKARQLCAYFIWKYLGRKRTWGFQFTDGMHYQQIADALGYGSNCHASIIHCIEVATNRSIYEREYLGLVVEIDNELKNL